MEHKKFKFLFFLGETILLQQRDSEYSIMEKTILSTENTNAFIIDSIKLATNSDNISHETIPFHNQLENATEYITVINLNPSVVIPNGFRLIELKDIDNIAPDVKKYLLHAFKQRKGYIMTEWQKAVAALYVYGDYAKERYLALKADKEELKKSPISRIITAIIVSLISAVLYDSIIFQHISGISVSIFILTVILGGIFFLNKRMSWKNPQSYFNLFAALALSLNYAIYNNFLLSFFNIFAIPYFVFAFFYSSCNPDTMSVFQIIIGIIKKILLSFFPSFKYTYTRVALMKHNESVSIKNNQIFKGVSLGLILGIPMLVIICGLLTSADAVFNNFINSINIDIGQIPLHLIVIIIGAMVGYGLLWSFYSNHKPNPIVFGEKTIWNNYTLITILTMIDFAYLFFTIIQAQYLYAKGNLPDGLTYAQYAQRGFGELCAIGIINIVIVLLFIKFSDKQKKSSKTIVNILLSITSFFSINMLISSFIRMDLYQNEYGFTDIRFYVFAILLGLGISFITILISIWINKVKPLRSMWYIAISIYVALNIINVNGIVACQNIQKANAEGGKLDIQYIKALSYDAYDAIATLENYDYEYLKDDLFNQFDYGQVIDFKAYDKKINWFEYNYYRDKVRNHFKN